MNSEDPQVYIDGVLAGERRMFRKGLRQAKGFLIGGQGLGEAPLILPNLPHLVERLGSTLELEAVGPRPDRWGSIHLT